MINVIKPSNTGYLATQLKNNGLGVCSCHSYPRFDWANVRCGVHFPQDVIVGEAIGLALFVACTAYEPRVGAWFTARTSLAIKLALAIAMPLALVIHEFVPSENPTTVKS